METVVINFKEQNFVLIGSSYVCFMNKKNGSADFPGW